MRRRNSNKAAVFELRGGSRHSCNERRCTEHTTAFQSCRGGTEQPSQAGEAQGHGVKCSTGPVSEPGLLGWESLPVGKLASREQSMPAATGGAPVLVPWC